LALNTSSAAEGSHGIASSASLNAVFFTGFTTQEENGDARKKA